MLTWWRRRRASWPLATLSLRCLTASTNSSTRARSQASNLPFLLTSGVAAREATERALGEAVLLLLLATEEAGEVEAAAVAVRGTTADEGGA